MALMNYATVFASAGFAGGSFDICSGYGASNIFTAVAGDAAFVASGKTITLTVGSFPAAFAEVGKKIVVTGAPLNNGTYTIVSLTGANKILTVLETLVDETPVGAASFDGSVNPGLIDVLLKTGNGILTVDAPLVLYSTGALTASRTLNIAALEVENTEQGSEPLPGRFFMLSVLNSDVSPSVSITMSATTSINDLATFPITSAGDYMFVYLGAGKWRCNILPRPSEGSATAKRVYFAAADWNAGATKNQIKILQTGSPVGGEVGPHLLTAGDSYCVDVYNFDLGRHEIVDVEVSVDASGNIFMVKAQGAKAFSGVAFIVGTLD